MGSSYTCPYVDIVLVGYTIWGIVMKPMSPPPPLPLPSASAKGSPQLSMTALLQNILTQEGVPGLYRGLSPNLLKVIPAVSISYVVYEYTRKVMGVGVPR